MRFKQWLQEAALANPGKRETIQNKVVALVRKQSGVPVQMIVTGRAGVGRADRLGISIYDKDTAGNSLTPEQQQAVAEALPLAAKTIRQMGYQVIQVNAGTDKYTKRWSGFISLGTLQQRPTPAVAYHTTPTKNLPRIAKIGLLPGSGNHTKDRIFLTTDSLNSHGWGNVFNNFAKTQNKEEYSVLTIDMKKVPTRVMYVDTEGNDPEKDFFIMGVKIPPEAIVKSEKADFDANDPDYDNGPY